MKHSTIRKTTHAVVAAILSLTLLFIPVTSFGAASLAGPFNQQFDNTNGTPCNGCKLYFYETTTTTPKDTWTDNTQAVKNPNPIALNTRGESTNNIFMNGTYRVKLTTPLGSTIWQRDGITGLSDAALTALMSRWQATGLTPTYVSGTSFTTLADNRTIFPTGRRVEIVVSAGTIYGRVVTSTYASPLTTTVVAFDSGAIDTGISSVNVSMETPTNTSISADMVSGGTITGDFISTGTVTFSNAVISGGSATFSNAVISGGSATFSNAVISGGSATFSNAVISGGSATFSNAVISGGSATFSTVNLSTVTKSGTDVIPNLNAHLVDGFHASYAPGIGDVPGVKETGTSKELFVESPNVRVAVDASHNAHVTGLERVYLLSNAYYDGGWKHIASAGASRVFALNTGHLMIATNTDGAGTPGSAITWGTEYLFWHSGNQALTNTISWTPGAITAGSTATQDITVTGSAVGDGVLITSPGGMGFCNLYGIVVSTDTVRMFYENSSAVTRTPSSGTYRATVFK